MICSGMCMPTFQISICIGKKILKNESFVLNSGRIQMEWFLFAIDTLAQLYFGFAEEPFSM